MRPCILVPLRTRLATKLLYPARPGLAGKRAPVRHVDPWSLKQLGKAAKSFRVSAPSKERTVISASHPQRLVGCVRLRASFLGPEALHSNGAETRGARFRPSSGPELLRGGTQYASLPATSTLARVEEIDAQSE